MQSLNLRAAWQARCISLRDLLLELLAQLEAGFDFADEDLPFITAEELQRRLEQAAEEVKRLVDQMESRSTAQTAVRAVLFGQPNTGKSSLFNALTCKEHALVSEVPGTTRDYLAVELDFDGRKCQLIDTAGIRDGSSQAGIIKAPDRSAQEAAAEQIDLAHVRLLCLDATRLPDAWEQAELARGDNLQQIVVWTKIDAVGLNAKPAYLRRPLESGYKQPTVLTSSVTGEGLDRLREELRRMAEGAEMSKGDYVASTAARCRQSLHCADESLRTARNLTETKCGEELIAAEIRMALEELGRVVGSVYTDDVLERIFSRFCVGK